MDAISSVMGQFHFLRPEWLLLLIPALLLSLLMHRRAQSASNWQKVIAPELLPWLMEGSGKVRRFSQLWLIFWILGSFAMAGPTWTKIPLPVHKTQTPLVVIFDLSPSMLAQDLVPNRLTRAKLKLIDLLNQRKEGTTALISYAGEAFTVSPLTDDANTVAAMVPALHPGIMPIAGSKVEDAIELAISLVENTSQQQAKLLLITDGIDPAGSDALYQLLRDKPGFDLSILGVGTAKGSPIPLSSGGFARDRSGNIVVPQLSDKQLSKIALFHDGRYTTITPDDGDLTYLGNGFTTLDEEVKTLDERTTDHWHDTGYILVIALLPILLLMFRKGIIASWVLLPVILISTPQPVQANEPDPFTWQDLWLTADQQGAKALRNENFEAARQSFENPEWKASSAYRAGDFESAEQLFAEQQDATSRYNLGNALAKQGKLEQAIKAYEQALAQNPEMEDALTNKKLLEELLKNNQQNQQNQGQDQGQDQGQREEQQKQNQGDQQQQNQQSQNQDNEGQPEQQGNQQQPDNQQSSNSEQSQSDQQQHGGNSPEPSDSPEPTKNPEQQTPNEPQQEQISEQQGSAEQTEQQPDSSGTQQSPELAPIPQEGELSDEEQQKMAQWLRKIPDDPSGLLRKKFLYESRQRAMEQSGGRQPPTEQQRW